MTWSLKIRTSPGSLIAAEYDCPVHGRFAVDVPRDSNGDPPDDAMCCRAVGGEPCGERAPHVISAPGIARVRRVTAAVLGSDNVKPEFETWTDTTPLAEGQDLDDWKADRAKVWEREREREAREIAREL